ncbi:MAG TPA: gliding motility protein, partial [Myxococcaceae bacterium]|nr:gliding motility protein [Myxococcaceae bacterium]
PAAGGTGRKLAPRVQEFTFAPDSGAVAYLENYNVSSRAGTLGVAQLPEGAPKQVGRLVPNFNWSPDGKRLAFLARFLQPIFSVDLMLYPVGAEAATKVYAGVFGYGFTPQGDRLLLRSTCVREGRACDLFSADPSKPGEAPKKLLEGVYSFRTSDDGERLLVSYAKFEADLYDVAVYNFKTGERKTLDTLALLPPLFMTPDGSKVAYALGDRKRPGIYVADRDVP